MTPARKPACGAAELLRKGGPVRVPLRECCAAALIGVDTATGCVALEAPLGDDQRRFLATDLPAGPELAPPVSAGPGRADP